MKQWIKRLHNAVGKAIGVVAALLCFGTATALADSIDLSEVTADTNVVDGTTLTGTLGANVKITIADGATVTLKDVTITNLGNGCHWAGINCPGDAILVLEGANTVCAGGNSSGYHNYPGIWIAPEKTLTIQGDGSLTAYSGTGNAGWGSGIGGGYEIDCGNIVIEGGAITATGGKSAAGIGCGYYGACGDITITGGTIVSTGGTYSSALGGGCGATCGDITIAATVTSLTATSTPTSGAVSDCIGAGSEGGTCGTVTIGGVTGPVLDSPFTFMPVDLAGLTEDTTIPDGAALCGTLAGNVKISIAPGAKVTLNGADINGDGTWTDGDYAGITCEGNATIILRGENNVKGFNADYPGIYVPEGSTLTIQGEGALDASSNGAGAGIGGGNGIACGNIVIAGGVITATGGTEAAGIGGGSGAACGDITITDASFGVTATKGEDAPYSIGAGKDGTGGTVTIGNEVGAIEDSPYTCNPPIDLSNVTEARTIPDGKTITGTLGATVKISIARNATVTLKDATINGVHNTEHYYAWSWAGITCEGDATIILEGENAVRGFCADYPGIFVPEGSTLTIQGEGSLDASSNGWGAGIGGGDGSEYYISCGNIVIEGGTIVATGGKYAAAIGSGEYSDCGTITIADSVTSVTAIKGDNAPYSIGAGSDGSCGTVTIGGTVYPDGITQSPYIYPTYTATLKDGTEDAANWTITPNEGLSESNTVTVAYAGENKVKSVRAKKGTEEIIGTPVEGKPNEWTFQMPDGDVEVEVAYLAVATFEVEGETYAVITNVVGKAVETPAEDPVKTGHSFAGWFTAATGGTQITDETLMGIADTTFYAQFRAPILTIENGVLTAVDFNGCTDIDLVIPTNVTAISDSAFYQCTGLASVTIPGSVKTISHAAFRDCSNLTSVTIEEGVTTIGERAFARCVNLASITIPGTVTAISEAAFSDCKSLTSLTIPGSVKTIGPQAFQNCTGLESVTLEEGVETIDRVAFDGCENLASVTIPDSVTSIGKDAFAGCSDALYEEGSGNLAGVKLVDGWAVGYDKASISENLDLTGVRGIAGGAFAGCDVITSVIIPDGVATIPEYVFNGCDNLTGVTIPDSVTSIGEGAFGGCDNFASVTIPDSVTSIGKDAFEGCSEELFDTTTIPGVALVDGWAVGYTDALPENLDLTGVRGIADNAFRESKLESVTIPGTVARVPAGAFMSCSSLASVTLEEGVTAIDDSAFIECAALESVEIPDTVTAIGPQAFVSCAKLASVTVPGSVAEIGPAAFGMCNSLTNITIEAGVTNIGTMAFAMCSALESVEIPDTVTAIGSQAFMMSMNFASVTIPSSVKEIGQEAFLYTALATVKVSYGDGERVKEMLAASGLDVSGLTFVEPLMLTFDPAGGEFAEGVETNRFLYASEEFGELPEPTRTGYTFKGWFTAATEGDGVTALSTMGKEDATVYAQWEINQYTITFDSNGGSDVAAITNDYGTAVTAPEAPTKTGYTFTGWTPAVPETVPASNMTCVAGWSVNSHSITFDVNGGEGEFDPVSLDYGAAYGELPEPVRTGYTFKGWFTAATNGYEVAATNTMGEADATIYAQWEINQYTITFDSNGGSDVATVTNDYGTAVTAPEAPTKTGYTFTGWTPAVPETVPASNMTCVAGWSVNNHSIAFDVNGGEGEFDPVSLDYGAEYGELPAPARTGYTFTGWTDADGNEATAETVLGDADVTLTAQWEINQYTITFDSNGGSDVATVTNDYGTAVTAPEAPTKTGYTFTGWTPAVPETVPASNMTCVAGWSVNSHSIAFDVNGGEGEFAPVSLDYGAAYGELPEATRTGYTFKGWVDGDGNEATAETVLGDADVTLTAQWEVNRYTVTFVVEGETYAAVTNDYGAAVTAPADPDRGSMYQFLGWDADVPATIPAEDVTLTALWKTMTVAIPAIANGDTNETVTVTVGEVYTDAVIDQITAAAQATAPRHGLAVTGWTNYDGSEVTGATVVSTNDVLSAVWDTVNPLVPETKGKGAVDASTSQKYEAYILDADGATRGTVVVTVGRSSRRTGLSSVKAQVKLVGESKTYTFKATEAKGGKAALSTAAATEGVELYNKNLGTMTLDMGSEGVSGALGEYEINGSRNVYKTDKAAYAAWTGTWTAAIAAADGGAYSTFSIKVRKTGAVNVSGVTADGVRFSVSTRLMVADDGREACVAVKGTKKAPVGFTLWLGLDADGAACAEGVESAAGDAVAGEGAAAGKAAVADAETWTLSAGGEAIATLGWNGSRFSKDKTASATVTYAKQTGLFSGSYKIATTAANGTAKKTTVKFRGVFVDGVGYGATTKGAAVAPVALVPASAR